MMASGVVAAIDIGSTFSGYAYRNHDDLKTKFPQHKFCSGGNLYWLRKVPTYILIKPDGKTFDSFGYPSQQKYVRLVKENEHNKWFFFKHFKLWFFSNGEFRRSTCLHDVDRKPLQALTVFQLAIQYFKDELLNELRAEGRKCDDILWVLTVPVYNKDVESFMHEAAENAGLSWAKVKIIRETDAAAICARQFLEERSNRTSSTSLPIQAVVIVNAGGGKIWISIHNREGFPNEIKSYTVENLCGSVIIREFKNVLTKIFGKSNIKRWKSQNFGDYLDFFRAVELGMHRRSPWIEFKIPSSFSDTIVNETGRSIDDTLSKSSYQSEIIVKDSKLKISEKVISSFYDVTIRSIFDLIEKVKQRHPEYIVSDIIMIGGLSGSTSFSECVRSRHGKLANIHFPENHDLAVLDGALMYSCESGKIVPDSKAPNFPPVLHISPVENHEAKHEHGNCDLSATDSQLVMRRSRVTIIGETCTQSYMVNIESGLWKEIASGARSHDEYQHIRSFVQVLDNVDHQSVNNEERQELPHRKFKYLNATPHSSNRVAAEPVCERTNSVVNLHTNVNNSAPANGGSVVNKGFIPDIHHLSPNTRGQTDADLVISNCPGWPKGCLVNRHIFVLEMNISKMNVNRKDEGIMAWTLSEYSDIWWKKIQVSPHFDSLIFKHAVVIRGHFDKGKEASAHKIKNDVDMFLKEQGIRVVDWQLIESDCRDDWQKEIFEVVKDEYRLGGNVPDTWIKTENLFARLKADGVKVISRSSFDEVRRDYPGFIQNHDEFENFLKFHQDNENILYSEENVILNKQWLIGAFDILFAAEHQRRKSRKEKKRWHRFNKTKVIDEELIDIAWESDISLKYKDHREIILDYLQRRMNYLIKIGEQGKLSVYLAVCALTRPPHENLLKKVDKHRHTTSKLCFKTPYFSPDQCFRLLRTLCKKFPVSASGKEYHIYSSCGLFDVENDQKLSVLVHHNVINVWISKEGSDPSAKTGAHICTFIRKILQQLKTNVQIYVKCPTASAFSDDNMFKLETLLQGEKVSCRCKCQHDVEPEDLKKYWCGSSVGSDRSQTDIDFLGVSADAALHFPERREDTITTVGVQVSSSLSPYATDRTPRGLCIIINNEKFLRNDQRREGSHLDRDRIERTFQQLHFNIRCFNNLSTTDMKTILSGVASEDHSQFDLIVIFILTHGQQGRVLGTDNLSIEIPDITKLFTADKCRSLIGKPKLFFIQACQGDSFMTGVAAGSRGIQTDVVPEETIPNEADFLVGHSSFPGYVSHRQPEAGSWYISALCEVLTEYHDRLNILDMLTEVNRKVSENSSNTGDGSFKQMPTYYSTLRHPLYLR